jgi:hypothetical protein
MPSRRPIHDLAELAMAPPGQADAEVYLTPQSVQAALSALRAHIDMLSAAENDPDAQLFRVEALDGTGAVQRQLAVANDLRLARAAFDEATKTPGRMVRLRQGSSEIDVSK